MFAKGADMHYSVTKDAQAATAASHFIAAGERLDIKVPIGGWYINVIGTGGSLEISELA